MQSSATMKTFVPCLQVCLLMLTWGWTYGNRWITCTATTSHLQSAINCFFHGDLSQLKNNFNAKFYYPPKTTSPDILLACNWLLTGRLKCSKSRGVKFNNNVTDWLTFTGPPMVDKVGGEYMCHVLTREDISEYPCTLIFIEPDTGTKTNSEADDDKQDEPDTGTKTNSEADDDKQDEPDTGTKTNSEADDDKQDVAITALAFAILEFVLPPLIVVLLYIYRSRVSKCIIEWAATFKRPDDNGDCSMPLLPQPVAMAKTSADGQAFTSPAVATDLQILIITIGSSKSNLANTITGSDSFPVDHSTAGRSTNMTPTVAVVTRFSKDIKVVDTPYIFGPSYSEEDQRRQVSEWKLMTSPGPSAILLALSGKDVFTSQHYDDYQKLKTLWGEDFCRRLIIVFTFTDEPHAPSLEEQLKVADPKLKCILQSTGDYYKVNNTVSEEENSVVVQQILNCVESKAAREDTSPYHPQAAASCDPQKNASQGLLGQPRCSGIKRHPGHERGSVRGKLPCYAGMTEVLAQKEGTKIDQRNAQKLYLTSNGFERGDTEA